MLKGITVKTKEGNIINWYAYSRQNGDASNS
jgi:hypothetical protein